MITFHNVEGGFLGNYQKKKILQKSKFALWGHQGSGRVHDSITLRWQRLAYVPHPWMVAPVKRCLMGLTH
jgi:hypothetical protein